jgi:hypothetical protein
MPGAPEDPVLNRFHEEEPSPRMGARSAAAVELRAAHAAGLFFRHDPEETAECASP